MIEISITCAYIWHRTSINRKYKSSTHRHNILEPIQYLRQMNSVSCTDNEFMPLWSKFSHSPSSKLWTGWSKSSHRPTTKAVGSFRDWGWGQTYWHNVFSNCIDADATLLATQIGLLTSVVVLWANYSWWWWCFLAGVSGESSTWCIRQANTDALSRRCFSSFETLLWYFCKG